MNFPFQPNQSVLCQKTKLPLVPSYGDTKLYRAPERDGNVYHTKLSDWFSFGLLMGVTLDGHVPRPSRTDLIKGPKEARKMIEDLTQTKPERRPFNLEALKKYKPFKVISG